MTKHECILWKRLRKSGGGFSFRKQFPIGRYIADFANVEKRLIVELDGLQHSEEKQVYHDAERDKFLQDSGYRILRFWNDSVIKNIDGVLATIYKYLNNDDVPELRNFYPKTIVSPPSATSSPLPPKGGETRACDCLKNSRGSMLTELLLAAAIAAAIIPFIARQEMQRIDQTRAVAAATELQTVRDALEKYIKDNRTSFESGSTPVEISSLGEYLGTGWEKYADKMRARVVKNESPLGGMVLRGIVSSSMGTAMRTATIAQLAGGSVDQNMAMIPTRLVRGQAEFIMRGQSDNPDDSRMESDLDMNGFSIINAGNISANYAKANIVRAGTAEFLILNVLSPQKLPAIASDAVIFKRDLAIATDFSSESLTVSGNVSATKFTAADMIAESATATTVTTKNAEFSNSLKSGSLSAISAFISGGILTKKLKIAEKISDPEDPSYFWNIRDRTGVFYDVQLAMLGNLLRSVAKDKGTAGESVRKALSNANATATDFIMALSEMRDIVMIKYNDLELN